MFDSTRDQDILCSHTSWILQFNFTFICFKRCGYPNTKWIFIEVSCNSELIRKIIFLTPGYTKLSLLGFLQFPNVSLFATDSWCASSFKLNTLLRSSYRYDQYQTKNYNHHQVHRDDDCFESGALKKRTKFGNCPVNYTQKLMKHSLFFPC